MLLRFAKFQLKSINFDGMSNSSVVCFRFLYFTR